MVLCKRHCPAVKPAVDDFRHTVHFLSTMRTLDRHRVDEWTMQFDVIRTVVWHGFQLFDTSDRMHMSAFTLPYVEWCSPVTVTADSPVLHILKPVSETSFSDAFRNPVDRIVISDQILFDFCHLDEPWLTRIVDQWCITSPAVRIAVLKVRCSKQKSSLLQIFQYHRIYFLTESPCPRCLLCHLTLLIY